MLRRKMCQQDMGFEEGSVEETEQMAHKHALRDLVVPPTNQQPLYITCPNLDVVFKLKFGMIYLLPKFRGLESENPYKHLKEFHAVCSSIKPLGVYEEHIKLRAFPFSLYYAVKE